MKMKLAGFLALFSVTFFVQAQLDKTCLQEIGRKKAHKLVQQCIQVSPATRPPCNSSNSCRIIKKEIRRGCGLIKTAKEPMPSFCQNEISL